MRTLESSIQIKEIDLPKQLQASAQPLPGIRDIIGLII